MTHLLIVINNFDIFPASLGPTEANSELLINSNAVLTLMARWQHI